MSSDFRVLINGCSFTRGPDAWPYHLESINQTQFTNLALSSAGNTYIHESTVFELSQRRYQGVIIMWSGISRIDTTVEYPDQFDSSSYTSKHQYKTNDWPEKIISPIDDQSFVDQSWVFGLGHTNQDKTIWNSKLFDGQYRYLGTKQFEFHFLQKIIGLQGILKNLMIPYIFTFYQPYQNQLLRHQQLCKLVDWDNFFIQENIFEIAKRNNDIDKDGHPGVKSNKQWASLLDKEIFKKILKVEHA